MNDLVTQFVEICANGGTDVLTESLPGERERVCVCVYLCDLFKRETEHLYLRPPIHRHSWSGDVTKTLLGGHDTIGNLVPSFTALDV